MHQCRRWIETGQAQADQSALVKFYSFFVFANGIVL
jgi:hypothetical protein